MAHEIAKLILQKKSASDTVGTITLRVKVPGKDKYIKKALNYRIPEKFWDKKAGQIIRGYPNYLHINNQIRTQKEELEASLISDVTSKKGGTKSTISARLRNDKPNSYILHYAQQHILRLQKRGFSKGYIKDWKSKFESKFELYGYQDLHFSDITTEWLHIYEEKLLETLKHNTAYMHMRKMKELLNMADNEGLFDRQQIRGYRWPAYKEQPKPYLVLTEIEKIITAVESKSLSEGDCIIASFFLVECLSGIRFSDWASFEIETLISKKRLKIGETKKTKQPIYLQIENSPRLLKIVYLIKERGYIFDMTEPHTNRRLKEIAKELKIKKHITTHVGRHTYAVLMLEVGYSKETIAEMLGVSMRVVDTYAKMTRKKIEIEYNRLGGL